MVTKQDLENRLAQLMIKVRLIEATIAAVNIVNETDTPYTDDNLMAWVNNKEILSNNKTSEQVLLDVLIKYYTKGMRDNTKEDVIAECMDYIINGVEDPLSGFNLNELIRAVNTVCQSTGITTMEKFDEEFGPSLSSIRNKSENNDE